MTNLIFLAGNKKINISNDGKLLYFGGDGGLAVLKYSNTNKAYTTYQNDPAIQYYGLRTTPSSHIVVQLLENHNLLVYSKDMKLVVDFKSRYEEQDILGFQRNNLFMEPHFSAEGDKIIWFGSPNSMFIVELSTLAQTMVGELLFEYDGLAPEPLCAIANFDQELYLVLFEIDDQAVLVLKRGNNEADPLFVDDVFPRFEGIKCLDLSLDHKIGFAGGWTRSGDPETGSTINRAIIAAFEFKEKLPAIAETELGASMITKIVMAKKQENALFALSDTLIFILELNRGPRGFVFEVKNQIDVHFEESKITPIILFL